MQVPVLLEQTLIDKHLENRIAAATCRVWGKVFEAPDAQTAGAFEMVHGPLSMDSTNITGKPLVANVAGLDCRPPCC